MVGQSGFAPSSSCPLPRLQMHNDIAVRCQRRAARRHCCGCMPKHPPGFLKPFMDAHRMPCCATRAADRASQARAAGSAQLQCRQRAAFCTAAK